MSCFRKEGVKREAQDLIQELQTEINKIHETINELDKTKDLQVRPKSLAFDQVCVCLLCHPKIQNPVQTKDIHILTFCAQEMLSQHI